MVTPFCGASNTGVNELESLGTSRIVKVEVVGAFLYNSGKIIRRRRNELSVEEYVAKRIEKIQREIDENREVLQSGD